MNRNRNDGREPWTPMLELVHMAWDAAFYEGVANMLLQARANTIPDVTGNRAMVHIHGDDIGSLMYDVMEQAYAHGPQDGDYVDLFMIRQHAAWIDRLVGYSFNGGLEPVFSWGNEELLSRRTMFEKLRTRSIQYVTEWTDSGRKEDTPYDRFKDRIFREMLEDGIGEPGQEPPEYVTSDRDVIPVRMRLPRRTGPSAHRLDGLMTPETALGVFIAESDRLRLRCSSFERPPVAAEAVVNGMPNRERVFPIMDEDFAKHPYRKLALKDGMTAFIVDMDGTPMADVYADRTFTRLARVYRNVPDCPDMDALQRVIVSDFGAAEDQQS